MKELTFTTKRISAKGERPEIAPQIITAKQEILKDEEDGWAFVFLHDNRLVNAHIAIAEDLDTKNMMQAEAEYLLATYRDER